MSAFEIGLVILAVCGVLWCAYDVIRLALIRRRYRRIVRQRLEDITARTHERALRQAWDRRRNERPQAGR